MRAEIVNRFWVFGLLALVGALHGCASSGEPKTDVEPTPVATAPTEMPERELLDVGIELFKSGASAEVPNEEEGIYPAIRDAESRFIPVHLKNTMQRTGYWGAVRVLPGPSNAVDVSVTGEIMRSDGEVLDLRVEAFDATGRKWFSHRYVAEAEVEDYRGNFRGRKDAFQDLYNTIANDLARYRLSLTPTEIRNIRTISELRFATDLAPDAFRQYLTENEDGTWQINRLPARDDPMLDRVLKIREREYMLVDTINGYYDGFYYDMWEPYEGWRKARSEEQAAMREVQRKARNRKILGAAAIAGAIAIELLGGGGNTASLRNIMLLGGAAAVTSGIDIGGQAEIHADAIRELGISFEAEVSPLVVEVEGDTVELTGSAETQYKNWRRLMKSAYFTETGLGGDDGVAAPKPTTPSGQPL